MDVRTASSFEDIRFSRPFSRPTGSDLSPLYGKVSLLSGRASVASLGMSLHEAPWRERFNDHGLLDGGDGASGIFGGLGGGWGGWVVDGENFSQISFGGTGGCE